MYWGKIIGTLAGLATTKPLLALLGLFLGHQFDCGFAERFRQFSNRRDTFVGVNPAFVATLFRCMGHLAKVDGRVSEDEIRAARSVMHRIGLGPAEVRRAITWFNEGKQGNFQLQATIREFRRVTARHAESRATFLRLLLEVALAKPRLGRAERAAIWTVCTELEIGRVELAQLEAMIRAQKGFRRSTAGGADSAKLGNAYRTLGLDQSATNDEIKKAYRRLMNKNHPDKLAAGNPDAAVVAESERRTREVRSAWELLKVRRAIR